MKTYTAADGTQFTEQDIEEWAAEAESECGYAGGHLGPSVSGRPVSVGAQAKPFTVRLDANRRAKLERVAKEQDVTPSDLLRGLIDTLDEAS